MKVLVVFYSMYGHIYRLAEAIAEGARDSSGNTSRNSACPRDVTGGGTQENGCGRCPESICSHPRM